MSSEMCAQHIVEAFTHCEREHQMGVCDEESVRSLADALPHLSFSLSSSTPLSLCPPGCPCHGRSTHWRPLPADSRRHCTEESGKRCEGVEQGGVRALRQQETIKNLLI
jgi:hypothetical protein